MSSELDLNQETAIQLDQVCKSFQIYDKPHHRLLQGLFRGKKQYFREFVALNDISFEIRRGQTVGIIGRNGAGKSTLLQIICGTMSPTSGSVEVNGRVAALLELGSGFNPEFSGRENVYLNGSILGLTREEIDERFDKIEEFAGIGDYIDQPVKTYSSGMYVRLAFAVIAHVDADVLIIDEALAVGDAIFTQKCMRFIRSFKKTGTLIFVSHDMNSVLNLCEEVVWLSEGKVRTRGEAKQVAEEYLQYTLQEVYSDDTLLTSTTKNTSKKKKINKVVETVSVSHEYSRSINSEGNSVTSYESEAVVVNNLDESCGWETGDGEIIDVSLEELHESTGTSLKGGEMVQMLVTAVAHKSMENPILGFLVRDRLGQDLFGENTLPQTQKEPFSVEAGETFSASFIFKLPMLPNGQYTVMISFADGDLVNNVQHHLLHDALVITVSSSAIRWGLVGIEFDEISLRKKNGL
ncbi:ABC transporter ATP-binding protein [Gimesia sp.]|uniref:ABC transporter ATP-binding protein n=1 Tax=Gimesia sp. TaxID=2024833 RepID=UPI003A94C335